MDMSKVKEMANDMRPTPTLTGRSAERFLKIIKKKPSKKRQQFLEECVRLFDATYKRSNA